MKKKSKRMADGGPAIEDNLAGSMIPKTSMMPKRNTNAAIGGGRGAGLPPGLAKRGPGNLPPGLANMKTLPSGITRMSTPAVKPMRGGGLARKGVGMALAAGGLARRAGGVAKRGVGKGKMC